MFLLIRDIILHRCNGNALCVFSIVLGSLIYDVSFITMIHLFYRIYSFNFILCMQYADQSLIIGSQSPLLSYSYML